MEVNVVLINPKSIKTVLNNPKSMKRVLTNPKSIKTVLNNPKSIIFVTAPTFHIYRHVTSQNVTNVTCQSSLSVNQAYATALYNGKVYKKIIKNIIT